MTSKKTLWPLEPHTAAKIQIVRDYLNAWLPILAPTYQVVYFDGFSGPGRYAGGESGSPIVAMETTLGHQATERFKCVHLIFAEKDLGRFNHLQKLIKKYHLPSNVKVYLRNDEFDGALTKYLDSHQHQEKTLFPTFLFVDPFGVSGVKMSTLKRFIVSPMCEFLLNFNINSVRRFYKHPNFKQHLQEIYGDDSWETCFSKDSVQERSACLSEVFENQISGLVEFNWRFDMYDKNNILQYHLFYGTNSLKGLEAMKDAMWATSPGGLYEFRSKYDKQLTFLEELVNFEDLATRIFDHFEGQVAAIEDIEKFVLVQTDYRKNHTKRALQTMEATGSIEVISNRNRKYTYPKRTMMKFM